LTLWYQAALRLDSSGDGSSKSSGSVLRGAWLVLHLRANDAQFSDLGKTQLKSYKGFTVALNTALNTALAEVRFDQTAIY